MLLEQATPTPAAASLDPTTDILVPLIVGLLVGLVLWLLAEGVRAWVRTVSRRRVRRRHIISLIGRAVALQARAINSGRIENAWVTNTMESLEELHERYDDLSAQALDLFETGEEVVAMWTAVELYAGWEAPFLSMDARRIPRESGPTGLVPDPPEGICLDPARPQELAEWAQVRWPWDRGSARGPRYAEMFGPGDLGRHLMVRPNSESPPGMLWPFVLYLADKNGRSAFPRISNRERRRLERLYPPERYQFTGGGL